MSESEDRNTTGIWSEGRKAPYEISRLEREKLLHNMVFRESYTCNAQKEDLCLEFVDNFRSQYVQLYPSRAPLMLTPVNELGVRKFISTFIKPSELQFEELYDAEPMARYFANYIRFDELDDKSLLPVSVVSPTTTLAWQIGNCLEMSLTLCSLLLGVGYDAYVIVGYAMDDVCSNTQQRHNWPGQLPVEKNADDDTEKIPPPPAKYTIKRRPNLESRFDREAAEKKDEDVIPKEEELFVSGNLEQGAEVVAEVEVPPKLLHSWILLRAGKRDVLTNVFVEVSTGAILPCTDPSYTGIETVFNHFNCWVNMQDGVAVKDITFDMRDLSKWENVFLTDPTMQHEDRTFEERQRYEDVTSDAGEAGDQILDVPGSWVAPLSLNARQYENRYPGMQKVIEYKDATVEYFAAYSEKDLKVTRVKIQDEYTNEHVHTFYKFREDKLRRYSLYPTAKEVGAPRIEHEWFESGRKKQDMARVEGLRELVIDPGKMRVMRFYWQAREDGLAKRVEVFDKDQDMVSPCKIMEYYRGRDDDRVVYRSATYDAAEEVDVGMTSAIGGESTHADPDQRVPRKMAEKFDRNPNVKSVVDVYKRTFIFPQNLVKGEVWVFYHYGDNQITRPFRMFPKSTDKDAHGSEPRAKISVLPFVPKPKESALVEELRVLLLREKECLAALRRNTNERKEILELRSNEIKNVKPTFSVYDTLRVSTKDSELEAEAAREDELRRQEARTDEIAQYIAQLPRAELHERRGDYKNVVLTPQEIQEVREKALGELKDRLIRRAHIMQNRLEEERERLAKKQSNFQKSQDMADNAKDHDEFLLFCEQATNRIKIFERRLEKHQTQALQRYAEMDAKLRAEKRLQL